MFFFAVFQARKSPAKHLRTHQRKNGMNPKAHPVLVANSQEGEAGGGKKRKRKAKKESEKEKRGTCKSVFSQAFSLPRTSQYEILTMCRPFKKTWNFGHFCRCFAAPAWQERNFSCFRRGLCHWSNHHARQTSIAGYDLLPRFDASRVHRWLSQHPAAFVMPLRGGQISAHRAGCGRTRGHDHDCVNRRVAAEQYAASARYTNSPHAPGSCATRQWRLASHGDACGQRTDDYATVGGSPAVCSRQSGILLHSTRHVLGQVRHDQALAALQCGFFGHPLWRVAF